MKYSSTDVCGVVKPIASIGKAASAVAMAMAFHRLTLFLPTHAPAMTGRNIVSMVRGNCSEPAVVVLVPMTLIAPRGE